MKETTTIFWEVSGLMSLLMPLDITELKTKYIIIARLVGKWPVDGNCEAPVLGNPSGGQLAKLTTPVAADPMTIVSENC